MIPIKKSGQIIATSHDLTSKGTVAEKGKAPVSGKSRLVKYYSCSGPSLLPFYGAATVTHQMVCKFGPMTCWEEKFHMSYQEFDFHRQFNQDTRVNLMISEVCYSEARDMADFTSRLVHPGLPSSFEVWNDNWQIIPHRFTEVVVHVRCQKGQFPLLDDSQSKMILANAFVVSEHPIVVQLDCQSVIYKPHSAKKYSIHSLELFSGGFGGWSMANKILAKLHNIN